MMKMIYMDNHATTQIDPRVLEVMLPYFTEHYGNPASRQHRFGWVAEEAVEAARNKIAKFLNAEPNEIIFTSGATESNNLAIKGIAEAYAYKGRHIITVATEHKSVLDSCDHLSKAGFKISYLPVDQYGLVDLNILEREINSDTILISVMYANNEIGTIQNINEIAKISTERNIIFHTDATQAVGKLKIDLKNSQIDLLSFSGHKIYGPKGIGVLYIKNKSPKVKLIPQMDGGGHERGLRSGTLNVPAIVGLAKALELCDQFMDEENKRLSEFRNKMQTEFLANLENVFLNGHPSQRIPNNLNISFLHVEDTALIMALKDIAVSSGSACSTANAQGSHVLKALRLSDSRIHSAIRFGLGRFNTAEEVDYVIDKVIVEVKKLRKLSFFKNKKVEL